jgi:hypothetical protein
MAEHAIGSVENIRLSAYMRKESNSLRTALKPEDIKISTQTSRMAKVNSKGMWAMKLSWSKYRPAKRREPQNAIRVMITVIRVA